MCALTTGLQRHSVELTIATGGGGTLKFPNDGDDISPFSDIDADAITFGLVCNCGRAAEALRQFCMGRSSLNANRISLGLITTDVAGVELR